MTLLMIVHDFSTALVLVSILPSERDLEIARLLGWYRIPLRTAPKIVDVDYLAFYQTAAFGEQHRWRIEQYAEVKGHELTTRAELLKDELKHPRADEEYFKIQIGQLSQLPTAILSGNWKRITFLYTTGERLLHAHFVKDLAPRVGERETLWRSLRERALTGGHYLPDELEKMAFDNAMRVFLGDIPEDHSGKGSKHIDLWDEY